MAKASTIRGLRIGSLKAIEPILEKWQMLNEESLWFSNEEAPWWYNERATLSIFAGAVWLCGGWVFEEFSTRKAVSSNRGKADYKTGRCDIQFGIGHTEFVAEAKQCWPILSGDIRTVRKVVETQIELSRQEAMQNSEWGYRCLGIVFVAPRVHKSNQARIDEYLHEFTNQLLALRKNTVAWTFPRQARLLRPSNESSNRDYIFPGVAMVMSLVKA